jgi:Uma2 family endonuclease
VYAISGGSQRHNLITGDVFAQIKEHLRGEPCRAFINDMKVHITPGENDYFYYPDIAVTCDPRDREHSHYIRHPKLLIEVLSPGPARIDRREKLFTGLD